MARRKRPRWKRYVDPFNVSGYLSDAATVPFGGDPKTTLGSLMPGENFSDRVDDRFGGLTGADQEDAAKEAARIQSQGAKDAMAYQEGMFERGAGAISPYQQQGQEYFNQYAQNVMGGAYDIDPQRYQYGGGMPTYQAPNPYQMPDMPGSYQQPDMPGQFDKGQYQLPQTYMGGQMPGKFDAGQYQLPGTYTGQEIQNKTPMPGQFDKSQYQLPQTYQQGPVAKDFSFTAQDYQQSPEAKLLADQSMKAIQRSAAARGGLASGATLTGLGQTMQDITAKDFQNQYGRALGTHQQNLGQAERERGYQTGRADVGYGRELGERGFGYGQHMDERMAAERDRAYGTGLETQERAYRTGREDVGYGRGLGERQFGYGQYMDELGRAERDRGYTTGRHDVGYGRGVGERDFGYGQYMDQLGRAERDRSFGYGQHMDERGAAERDRAFGYGVYGDDRSFGRQTYLDELGRAEGDRQFDYGTDQDYYANLANEMSRRQQSMSGLAQLGPEMAVNYANMTQGLGGNVSDLYTQIANAQAAGVMGGANARTQALQNLLGLGGQLGTAAIVASDRRLKTDINRVGKHKGYNVYTFRYKGGKHYYKGVMADEVQKVNPGAVTVLNGFLAVDYGRL